MIFSGSDISKLHFELAFVFNRKSTPAWSIHNDYIDYHNLIYIHEGSGYFDNGSKKQKVQKGNLVYFSKGDAQHMVSDPDNLLQFYTVNFHTVLPTYSHSDSEWHFTEPEFDLRFVTPIHDEAIRQQFSLHFERLDKLYLAGKSWKRAKQREIFSKIMELADSCQRPNSINYNLRNSINRTVYFMTEHYHEKITLADLTEIAGLSSAHYSSIFRTITGRSPIDYLIHIRISKAKQLIEDGISISEVAELTGFSDIYYFSRIFKKHDGLPPSAYKK